MQNLLLIDTTSSICQVAITWQDRVWAEKIDGANRHTECILPLIASLFEKAKLELKQDIKVDAISVTQGPGSFTGVRVGFCVAQGLAYGWNIPLIPIPTLQVLAQSALKAQPHLKTVMVLMDARMQEVYAGFYEFKEIESFALAIPLQEDCLLTPEKALALYQSQQSSPTQNDQAFGLYGDALIAYPEVFKHEKNLLNQAKPLNTHENNQSLVSNITSYINLEAMILLAKHSAQMAPLETAPIYVRNQVTHQKDKDKA